VAVVDADGHGVVDHPTPRAVGLAAGHLDGEPAAVEPRRGECEITVTQGGLWRTGRESGPRCQHLGIGGADLVVAHADRTRREPDHRPGLVQREQSVEVTGVGAVDEESTEVLGLCGGHRHGSILPRRYDKSGKTATREIDGHRGRRSACHGQYGHQVATVLLVEDDHVVRGAMLRSLADRGHAVHAVGTALDALRRVAAETPDLVVLDLGLPDLDGADALRMLRGITDVPIIIATARDDEQGIVRLLRAGADDYMVKPFTGAHLDARITTVLRRVGRASRTVQPAVHEVGGLKVDVGERSALLDGTPLALTRKEFDLLAYLAARPGRVVSRRELLEEVWRQPSVGEDQTIDVHLYWLRRKLGESAAKPRYLRTVRGVGFRLVAPD
jgi:DNA-binding response OmpR family regulator